MHSSSHKTSDAGIDVYHLESPSLTSGKDLLQWILVLSDGLLQPTSVSDWLAELSASESVQGAGKLYDFFQVWLDEEAKSSQLSSSLVPLSVAKTLGISPTMDCGPVTKELTAKYLRYAVDNL